MYHECVVLSCHKRGGAFGAASSPPMGLDHDLFLLISCTKLILWIPSHCKFDIAACQALAVAIIAKGIQSLVVKHCYSPLRNCWVMCLQGWNYGICHDSWTSHWFKKSAFLLGFQLGHRHCVLRSNSQGYSIAVIKHYPQFLTCIRLDPTPE